MIKYFTIEDLLKHYLQKKFHILAKKQYLLTAPFYEVSVCQSWNVLLALLMIAMITLEHFYKGDKTS